MHVVEVRQAQERRALDQLQAATGVRGGVLEQAAAQVVGEPRGVALARGVTAIDPVPGHQLYIDLARFAAHQRQHAGNVRRVVLAVAIEGRQPLPACLTGRVVQRGALPQRPLVMQDAQGVQAVLADLPQFLQGRIGAAIVDHDDFVSLIGQRHADFFKQWLEVVRFVLGGNQYGYKNVLAHGVSLALLDFFYKRRIKVSYTGRLDAGLSYSGR
ncbi:hypothetical protein D3C71_1434990 [compost metagenome]